MKLLAKYNRINLIATIAILLCSAAVYYFVIRHTLVHQLDKELKTEEREFKESVHETNALPEAMNNKDEQQQFLLIQDSIPRKFSSIDVYNRVHKEFDSYRQLEFAMKVGGKYYKVTIRKSQEETEDLIKIILLITLGIVFILLLSLYIINRIAFSSLWKPFSNTLQQLRTFDISGNKPLHPQQTTIDEFNQLNHAVHQMTNKAIGDYNEIRSFTENASHEIQTPLAIIKSKLEILSQGDTLKEDQMDDIQTIFEAANRLSRLNQSLLLLTKIDNRQFHDVQKVDLKRIINTILSNYEELVKGNDIKVNVLFEAAVFVQMNEALAEILVSNLVTNAIKHNIKGGVIKITLNEKNLIIANSGKTLDIPPEQLFERFRKEKAGSDSLGLGLSIVKKITDTYNFSIEYTCLSTEHVVTIRFPAPSVFLQN